MSRRSRAREIVLQILYQHDLNPDQPADVSQRFIHSRLNYDRSLVAFAESLISGVQQHLAVLDERLEATAQNWKLSRMPATDRNVLRLGTFEILFTDTPDRVAINEAIELAKRYGTPNSAQFVNGILDRLMNHKPDDDQNASQRIRPQIVVIDDSNRSDSQSSAKSPTQSSE